MSQTRSPSLIQVDFTSWPQLKEILTDFFSQAGFKYRPHFHLSTEFHEANFTGHMEEYTRTMRYWTRDALHVFLPLSLFYISAKAIFDPRKRSIEVPGIFSLRRSRGDAPHFDQTKTSFNWSRDALKAHIIEDPGSISHLSTGSGQPNEFGNLDTAVPIKSADAWIQSLFDLRTTYFPTTALREGETLETITQGFQFHRNTESEYIKSLTPGEAKILHGIEKDAGAKQISRALFGLSSCVHLLPWIGGRWDMQNVQVLRRFYTAAGKLDHSTYKAALESFLPTVHAKGSLARLDEYPDITALSESVRRLEKILSVKWYELREAADSVIMYHFSMMLPEYPKLNQNLTKYIAKLSHEERCGRFHDYYAASMARNGTRKSVAELVDKLKSTKLPPVKYEPADVPEGWQILIPESVLDVREMGLKQRHCVYSSRFYDQMMHKNRILFSLYREKLSDGVTCEMAYPRREILQIKGLQNRAPSPEEAKIVSDISKNMFFLI